MSSDLAEAPRVQNYVQQAYIALLANFHSDLAEALRVEHCAQQAYFALLVNFSHPKSDLTLTTNVPRKHDEVRMVKCCVHSLYEREKNRARCQ